MKSKTYHIFLGVMALALATLACATFSGGSPTPVIPDLPTITVPTVVVPDVEIPSQELPGATDMPEMEPSATAETPSNGNANPGSETINLEDPALWASPTDVNSFRMSMNSTFSGQTADGTAVTNSVSGEGAYSLDPMQLQFTFNSVGSDGTTQLMDIVQLDNTLYMASADIGCFSLPVDEGDTSNPYEELMNGSSFLLGQAHRVQPDETVNGIDTYVYEITTDNLDLSSSDPLPVNELTYGRLYLAKDTGYMVRLVMEGQGKNTMGTENTDLEGDVHYELNYYDQNQPVNVALPEGCAQGDTGGGVTVGSFPVPEGATDLITLTGITTFSSTQTPEELSQFYKTEMVAAGWTLDNEINVSGLVTLTFTKDGKTATVTITADPSTGKTQVAIFES